jgi:hypothetical protein
MLPENIDATRRSALANVALMAIGDAVIAGFSSEIIALITDSNTDKFKRVRRNNGLVNPERVRSGAR